MTAQAPEADRLTTNRIFGRTFSLVGARGIHMLLPALLLVVLPSAAFAYVSRTWASTDISHLLILQATGPLLLSLQSAFAGWVAFLAVDRANPLATQTPSSGRLGAVLMRLWAIIPTSIVLFFGLALGTLLLFVPGIIFGLATSVTMQALAVERLNPLRALSRSFELTRGRRGMLLGFALILFVPATTINLLGVELITGWKPLLQAQHDSNVVLIWQPLMFLVIGVLQSALFAEIYVALAGISSAAVADEFN